MTATTKDQRTYYRMARAQGWNPYAARILATDRSERDVKARVTLGRLVGAPVRPRKSSYLLDRGVIS